MLKRKMYDRLLEWKTRPDHHCLLIKGQPQVGKTFIIDQFGKCEYENYVYINLWDDRDARMAFEGNLDVNTIIDYLSISHPEHKYVPGLTMIFFDEIQECPNARSALKSFSMDGRFDVIASGSLLGVDLTSGQNSFIPVGYEEHVTMRSLDFEEFLWANGITPTQIEKIKEHIRRKEEIPIPYYTRFRTLFKEYMAVGGMPEAVTEYLKNRSLVESGVVQEKILNGCRSDINRYNRGLDAVKTHDCFDSIPSQLSKNNKKFMYSVVESYEGRGSSQKYEGNLHWIKGAGYGDFCYALQSPEKPLASKVVRDQFRIYMSDTGLLMRMMGIDSIQALYRGDTSYNFGAVMENAVSEAIWKCGYTPYFYKKTNGDNRMELDFVIQLGMELTFIEVKSGKSRDAPSLNKGIAIYGSDRSMIFADDNISIDGVVEHYPLFACAFMDCMEKSTDADGML